MYSSLHARSWRPISLHPWEAGTSKLGGINLWGAVGPARVPFHEERDERAWREN